MSFNRNSSINQYETFKYAYLVNIIQRNHTEKALGTEKRIEKF
jgi:hypothetical protein